jgi:hypothetical protein
MHIVMNEHHKSCKLIILGGIDTTALSCWIVSGQKLCDVLSRRG